MNACAPLNRKVSRSAKLGVTFTFFSKTRVEAATSKTARVSPSSKQAKYLPSGERRELVQPRAITNWRTETRRRDDKSHLSTRLLSLSKTIARESGVN